MQIPCVHLVSPEFQAIDFKMTKDNGWWPALQAEMTVMTTHERNGVSNRRQL